MQVKIADAEILCELIREAAESGKEFTGSEAEGLIDLVYDLYSGNLCLLEPLDDLTRQEFERLETESCKRYEAEFESLDSEAED